MPMQLPAQFEQRPPHLHELQPMQLPPPFQQHPHLQELQPMQPQPHLHHVPEQHVALQPYWPPVQGRAIRDGNKILKRAFQGA